MEYHRASLHPVLGHCSTSTGSSQNQFCELLKLSLFAGHGRWVHFYKACAEVSATPRPSQST